MFEFFFSAILLNFFDDVIEFTFQTLIALVLSVTFCARHLGTSRYAWIHPGSKIEWLERVAVAMIIFIDFFLSSVWAFSYIVYFRSVSMPRFVNACIAMQTQCAWVQTASFNRTCQKKIAKQAACLKMLSLSNATQSTLHWGARYEKIFFVAEMLYQKEAFIGGYYITPIEISM